jgi:hypothetical protein
VSVCEATRCTTPATDTAEVLGHLRRFCGVHVIAAIAWQILDGPDANTEPPPERPCAICCEHPRDPGRACCHDCITRAYAVHATGGQR